jgi:hypothetical protein
VIWTILSVLLAFFAGCLMTARQPVSTKIIVLICVGLLGAQALHVQYLTEGKARKALANLNIK